MIAPAAYGHRTRHGRLYARRGCHQTIALSPQIAPQGNCSSRYAVAQAGLRDRDRWRSQVGQSSTGWSQSGRPVGDRTYPSASLGRDASPSRCPL
jgi:hypothetical protein